MALDAGGSPAFPAAGTSATLPPAIATMIITTALDANVRTAPAHRHFGGGGAPPPRGASDVLSRVRGSSMDRPSTILASVWPFIARQPAPPANSRLARSIDSTTPATAA